MFLWRCRVVNSSARNSFKNIYKRSRFLKSHHDLIQSTGKIMTKVDKFDKSPNRELLLPLNCVYAYPFPLRKERLDKTTYAAYANAGCLEPKSSARIISRSALSSSMRLFAAFIGLKLFYDYSSKSACNF